MATALPTPSSKSISSTRGRWNSEETSREQKEQRLRQLIEVTYSKIEAIRGYLVKEAAILGMEVEEPAITAVLHRQHYLMEQAISCFNREDVDPQNSFNLPYNLVPPSPDDRRSRKTAVSFKIDTDTTQISPNSYVPASRRHNKAELNRFSNDADFKEVPIFQGETGSYIDGGSDPKNSRVNSSWFGSLDRNCAKVKKEGGDKRRRHTKAIGSRAGLDIVQKSHELQPDEQYEIGLPRVSNKTSHKLTNSMHASHSYPVLPPNFSSDMVDYPKSNQIMNKSFNIHHHRQQSEIWEFKGLNWSASSGEKKSGIMEDFGQLRFGSNHAPPPNYSGHSPGPSNLTKDWFETNLDENPVAQLSPLLFSSRGVTGTGKGSSSGSRVSITDDVNDSISCHDASGPVYDLLDINSSGSNESWAGFAKESTKPFEMSDYYKYSTKFRDPNPVPIQSINGVATNLIPTNCNYPDAMTSLPEEKKAMLINYFTQQAAANPLNLKLAQPVDKKNQLIEPTLNEESRNNGEINFHPRKSTQEEAYRHPKPGVRSGSQNLTPLKRETRSHNLPNYFNRPALENDAMGSNKRAFTTLPELSKNEGKLGHGESNLISDSHDNYLDCSEVPDLPPKYVRHTNNLSTSNDVTSEPLENMGDLLAWMPDTPTFV